MNLLSIVMDCRRKLSADSYTLGVERDHKIDKIVLVADERCNETKLSDATVSLHLKAENGYTYNQICEERVVDNGVVRFFFHVTREMTCVSGTVRVEFYFESPSESFCFTSRSTELIIAKPLTDTSEVESDYPGMLSDVLTAVSGFSKELSDTNSLVSSIDGEIGILFDKQNENTLSIKNVEAYLGYTDDEILGLEADFENNTFARLAGARNLNAGADFDNFPMYQRRRCNVADDGTIVAYYGDENYRDDGSNGQVMVYQPKFYYRVLPTKLEKQEGGLGYHIRKANYYISAKPKPLFKLHPAFYDENGNEVEYILYSAYEGSATDTSESGTLCSVANAKPRADCSQTRFETLSNNRGRGWHLETIKSLCATQMLMMIEFASMNIQNAIGLGVVRFPTTTTVNCASITGSTAFLGNVTGSATQTVNEISGVETTYTENGKIAISYRGVENPYGNLWKHINGINLWGDGAMLGGQAYIASDFSFNNQKRDGNYVGTGFTCTNSGQAFVSAFGFCKEEFDWLFLASESKGTSVLPVGDQVYGAKNANGYKIALSGGAWNNTDGAGAFAYMQSYGIGAKTSFFGGRLIYVPMAK